MPDLTPAAFAAHFAPAACVFAAAFLQSATGFGLVMIASPLLMYFYDPKLVIVIVALVACCGNVTQSFFLRRRTRFSLVGWLTLGALAGQPIGLRIYQLIPSLWLKLVVSVVILLSLTVMQVFHIRWQFHFLHGYALFAIHVIEVFCRYFHGCSCFLLFLEPLF